jgi:hypothetical protein
VVDCTGLENRQRATVREFESHRFRQEPLLGAFFRLDGATWKYKYLAALYFTAIYIAAK